MDVSEDIVTRNFSGMNFDEVLEYLIQEVKARNYIITRITILIIYMTVLMEMLKTR